MTALLVFLGRLPLLAVQTLRNPRTLIVSAAVILLLAAYWKGRDDCGDKHRRKAAQEAAEWTEKVRVSEAQAYARGLQAAKSEARNEKTVEEIVRDAGMEAGAADICVSAGIVERLRQLQ